MGLIVSDEPIYNLPSLLSTAKYYITSFDNNKLNDNEFDDHNAYDRTKDSECSQIITKTSNDEFSLKKRY